MLAPVLLLGVGLLLLPDRAADLPFRMDFDIAVKEGLDDPSDLDLQVLHHRLVIAGNDYTTEARRAAAAACAAAFFRLTSADDDRYGAGGRAPLGVTVQAATRGSFRAYHPVYERYARSHEDVERGPPGRGGVGGWYDAADRDRRRWHYDVVYDLLLAYETAPGNFTDGQAPTYESRNGIPDIVDEAAWGLLVWRRSQDERGGVSGYCEQVPRCCRVMRPPTPHAPGRVRRLEEVVAGRRQSSSERAQRNPRSSNRTSGG